MKTRTVYWLPCLLWLAVFIAGTYIWCARSGLLGKPANSSAQRLAAESLKGNATGAGSGAVFVDVPWKHLPDVGPFRLTDQTGSEFDSSDLVGKVYAVSFFFASCPSICRDLNRQIQSLDEQLRGVPIRFVSVSVDPERDTPEILARYAADFGARPDRWSFLTGPLHRIRELGEYSFRVDVRPETHTDNLFLIDQWGRYRDRFKWDDPLDMKRFVEVARDLAGETSPPWDAVIRTRNALAGVAPQNWDDVPWIREFFLTDQQGRTFYSRDLIGEVWLASFFFTRCPGICPRQNEYLAGLRDRLGNWPLRFVSLSTDPQTDTTPVLNNYAIKFRADPDQWLFCRGEGRLVSRIASEFFRAAANEDHHSSRLFVVDRWGQVRGSFDWQDPADETRLLECVAMCAAEQQPPPGVRPIRTPETVEDE